MKPKCVKVVKHTCKKWLTAFWTTAGSWGINCMMKLRVAISDDFSLIWDIYTPVDNSISTLIVKNANQARKEKDPAAKNQAKVKLLRFQSHFRIFELMLKLA